MAASFGMFFQVGSAISSVRRGSESCGLARCLRREKVVDFAVDVCGGFFWSQNAKEKSAEKPPAENKKSAGARPPEIRQPGPKICRKTYQQIRLSNLQD